MSQQPDGRDDVRDTDADPENLSPRDDRDHSDDEHFEDPDADPENLNPRAPEEA